VVSGLANGAGHTVVVYAANAVGSGPNSGTGSVVPRTRPGAPRIGTPVRGDAAVTVRWTAPANGGSAITSYVVRAYRGSTLTATVSAAGGAVSAVVPGLTNGVGYTFTVTAANAAGAGPASSRSATVVPLGPPGAPVLGTLSPGDGTATVRWTPPAATGGTAIRGYVVRVTDDHGALVATVSAGASARSVVVPGLVNGVTYAVTVAATNAVGAGAEAAGTVTPSV
jgi:hypothetical protein